MKLVKLVMLIAAMGATSIASADVITLVFSNGWEVKFDEEKTFKNPSQVRLGVTSVDSNGDNFLNWSNGQRSDNHSMSRYMKNGKVVIQESYITSNYVASLNRVYATLQPTSVAGVSTFKTALDNSVCDTGVWKAHTKRFNVNTYNGVDLMEVWYGIHKVEIDCMSSGS